MIERSLRTLILVFLWGALVEDSALVLMAWMAPELWFQLFHDQAPTGLDVPFLRRSAGQWLAFALAQAIALWRYKKNPLWLPIVAGVRFSDLFTDVSYIVSVPTLTTLGWWVLVPPPFLNLAGVLILLAGYRQIVNGRGQP